MGHQNGSDPLAGIGELVILRTDNANLRKAGGALAEALKQSEHDKKLCSEVLAVLLHREDLDGTEVTNAERQATFDHCQFAFNLEVVKHDDEDPPLGSSVKLNLIPAEVVDPAEKGRAAFREKMREALGSSGIDIDKPAESE